MNVALKELKHNLCSIEIKSRQLQFHCCSHAGSLCKMGRVDQRSDYTLYSLIFDLYWANSKDVKDAKVCNTVQRSQMGVFTCTNTDIKLEEKQLHPHHHEIIWDMCFAIPHAVHVQITLHDSDCPLFSPNVHTS